MKKVYKLAAKINKLLLPSFTKQQLDITKAKNIFRVRNNKTQKAFDALAGDSTLLFHGSRTENYWGILNTGLKIKPANAVQTGSMLGRGTYFANKARKSIGYTSLSGKLLGKRLIK